ncbi:DUF5134 domain-containing protein [Actinoplanes sp. HUAS TT8]|uniref:DUF5134 domain-containing protein n=1 Tax=Actinoplanes sp. HUAS TT8 TaxID=3447453 RepID=UPI003F5259AD
MIGIASLQWLLTAAFAVAATFHLIRCVRPKAHDPLSELLHLIMSGSMIAMLWPWGARVPKLVWVTVFTVAACWFVARATRTTGRRRTSVFFATAAAAMIWMTAAPAAAHHHGHSPLGHAAVISAGLGGYLMLAAIWWVLSGMRLATPLRPVHWPALCHGLMSAGMAVALLAMA